MPVIFLGLMILIGILAIFGEGKIALIFLSIIILFAYFGPIGIAIYISVLFSKNKLRHSNAIPLIYLGLIIYPCLIVGSIMVLNEVDKKLKEDICSNQ